jgi:biotin transporter BioY
MSYLRNNAVVAAIFLAIGGLMVFVPLPDGLGFLTVFILAAMLASFFVASLLAIPDKYQDEVLVTALCCLSSMALSGFVVLATLTMAASHGCL